MGDTYKVTRSNITQVDKEGNLPPNNDSDYNLPIASPSTLGGVRPTKARTSENVPVAVDGQGGLWAPDGSYTLPVATTDTLGGVKPNTKTGAMTQPVGVDEEGKLYTEPGSGGQYELPVASPSTLGGVKPESKTGAMTQPVGVDVEGGLWTEPGSGEQYELPVASPSTLGGVKPNTKTGAMTQPVGVDVEGGLWTEPGSGGGYELPVAGSDTLGGVKCNEGQYNSSTDVYVRIATNTDNNKDYLYVEASRFPNVSLPSESLDTLSRLNDIYNCLVGTGVTSAGFSKHVSNLWKSVINSSKNIIQADSHITILAGNAVYAGALVVNCRIDDISNMSATHIYVNRNFFPRYCKFTGNGGHISADGLTIPIKIVGKNENDWYDCTFDDAFIPDTIPTNNFTIVLDWH